MRTLLVSFILLSLITFLGLWGIPKTSLAGLGTLETYTQERNAFYKFQFFSGESVHIISLQDKVCVYIEWGGISSEVMCTYKKTNSKEKGKYEKI